MTPTTWVLAIMIWSGPNYGHVTIEMQGGFTSQSQCENAGFVLQKLSEGYNGGEDLDGSDPKARAIYRCLEQ